MKQQLKAALRYAGLEIRRIGRNGITTFDQRRMKIMQRNGINLVLDVGANAGQYGSELRGSGYRGRLWSFEPYSEAFRMLQAAAARGPMWQVSNIGIGNTTGSATLNIAGNSDSCSFMPMLDRHLRSAPGSRYVGTEEVSLTTLDCAVTTSLTSEDRILLKIDTQGYEHLVLEGATRTLPQIHVVECELSLAPLYEGQLCFMEMIALLRDNGFSLVSVYPGFSDSSSGYCLQVEGMFARRETIL